MTVASLGVAGHVTCLERFPAVRWCQLLEAFSPAVEKVFSSAKFLADLQVVYHTTPPFAKFSRKERYRGNVLAATKVLVQDFPSSPVLARDLLHEK